MIYIREFGSSTRKSLSLSLITSMESISAPSSFVTIAFLASNPSFSPVENHSKVILSIEMSSKTTSSMPYLGAILVPSESFSNTTMSMGTQWLYGMLKFSAEF